MLQRAFNCFSLCEAALRHAGHALTSVIERFGPIQFTTLFSDCNVRRGVPWHHPLTLLEKKHNKNTIKHCILISQSQLYLPRLLNFGTMHIVPEILSALIPDRDSFSVKYNTVL